MPFKFSPGDTVCLAHPEDSGWTHRADLKKGQLGKVLHTRHENQDRLNPIIDRLNPIIVCCQFPGVSDAWWVFESELEFAEEPISVDTSSLL